MALKYLYTCIHTKSLVLEIIFGSTILFFDHSIVPDGVLAVVWRFFDFMDVVPVDNDDDIDIIDVDNSVDGDKFTIDDNGDDVDSCDENDFAVVVDGFVDFGVGVSDIKLKSQR